MDPPRLPQLAALVALGDGAAFALDLEEWPFGVVTRGSSVSFDAGFACEGLIIRGVMWGRDERVTTQTSCR